MNYQELWHHLAQVYDDGEAKAIARMVYEKRFGLTLSDIYLGKDTQLSANDQAELAEIARRLLRQEPVQYVLGEADFCGRPFMVSPAVLIPRPETEELCRWIISGAGVGRSEPKAILDIGTGSGCIAVTLAASLPDVQVAAWDISEEALQVAHENARRNHVSVSFERVDILHRDKDNRRWDLIVSNPPYICSRERKEMGENVLSHEPHTALFVPDDDPLLFYRAIAWYGQTALREGGSLYFEINPLYATDLTKLLTAMPYHDIEIKTDEYGKNRMLRARR